MKGPSNSERIYRAVKDEVLSGRFAPGERVDAVALAEEQFASITPIRSTLNRLVGERLIYAQASEGFYAPPLTEIGLRDLFTCNGQVLAHAVAVSAGLFRRGEALVEALQLQNGDIVKATESAFLRLAYLSGSEECAAGVASFNDRLHAVRRLEARLIPDQTIEFEALLASSSNGAAALRSALGSYHRRRVALVPALVRMRHRAPAE